jgi:hypothetical protein
MALNRAETAIAYGDSSQDIRRSPAMVCNEIQGVAGTDGEPLNYPARGRTHIDNPLQNKELCQSAKAAVQEFAQERHCSGLTEHDKKDIERIIRNWKTLSPAAKETILSIVKLNRKKKTREPAL